MTVEAASQGFLRSVDATAAGSRATPRPRVQTDLSAIVTGCRATTVIMSTLNLAILNSNLLYQDHRTNPLQDSLFTGVVTSSLNIGS